MQLHIKQLILKWTIIVRYFNDSLPKIVITTEIKIKNSNSTNGNMLRMQIGIQDREALRYIAQIIHIPTATYLA